MVVKKIGLVDSNIADNHTSITNNYYNSICMEKVLSMQEEIVVLKNVIVKMQKTNEVKTDVISNFAHQIDTVIPKIMVELENPITKYHEKLDKIILLLQREENGEFI